MKELSIDLELLIQSFSINEGDLGKEYLDTNTGEIINIPCELNDIVCGKEPKENLEDWQKELLKEAYNIKEDESKRYIFIPSIEDSYSYNVMVDFAKEKVFSENLREQLLNALDDNQPTTSFKGVIFQHLEELDKWQDYEEEKAKEYAINWLNSIGITNK